MKEYLVRYDFPKPCVTFNQCKESEFKGSLIDFYGDTLDEVSNIDISKCEFINLSKVRHYTKIIWRRSNKSDIYAFISREKVFL